MHTREEMSEPRGEASFIKKGGRVSFDPVHHRDRLSHVLNARRKFFSCVRTFASSCRHGQTNSSIFSTRLNAFWSTKKAPCPRNRLFNDIPSIWATLSWSHSTQKMLHTLLISKDRSMLTRNLARAFLRKLDSHESACMYIFPGRKMAISFLLLYSFRYDPNIFDLYSRRVVPYAAVRSKVVRPRRYIPSSLYSRIVSNLIQPSADPTQYDVEFRSSR